MPQKRLLIAVALIAFVALFVWRIEAVFLSLHSAMTAQSSLDDRIALIEKNIEIRLPDNTSGPVPAVLQFHGCAGARAPFQQQWADIATDNGYAAVIVDSNRPRGYSRANALDVVCSGKALVGQERAGDILAAIEIVKRNHAIDAKRLVFAGWSHGAWTIMDFMAMDFKGRGPAGLAAWPASIERPAGLILFYPYCGPGALSRAFAWQSAPPTLALIAGADTIVDAAQCMRFFEPRAHVTMTVYPGVEHSYDDPFIEPEWAHWHDNDAFQDSKNQYRDFIKSLNR